MSSHDSAGRSEAPWQALWGRLFISLTATAGDGEAQDVLAVVLKDPRAAQPLREAAAEPPAHQGVRETSAAANDPAVKALREQLKAHAALLRDFEAATGRPASDVLLQRWLAARKGQEAAAAGLLQHFRWRVALGPIREADIERELDAGKVFLQGCDAFGRAVVIVMAAKHRMGQRDLEETKRLITFTLETALATSDTGRNRLGQILCIFDLSGLGLNNLDSKALLAVFEVLQQHFPESLSQLLFLNAPFLFWGLWRVVSPFVQQATREKIRFLKREERARELPAAIPPKVLPSIYGGLAELVSLRQAARRLAAVGGAEEGGQEQAAVAAAHRGRLAGLRRSAGRAAGSSWAFVRDHNPVWAARTFAVGVRRGARAMPRPGWRLARLPRMRVPARASSMAGSLHAAWLRRPPLPRPSYKAMRMPSLRLKQPLRQPDARSLYLVAVSILGLAALLLWQSAAALQLPLHLWFRS